MNNIGSMERLKTPINSLRQCSVSWQIVTDDKDALAASKMPVLRNQYKILIFNNTAVRTSNLTVEG
jgi:hypothetical protein